MPADFHPEYGVVGAGGLSSSLIGQLPRKAVALGPVGGVSYRVASRIANTLKAGWPVRSLDELDALRLILFYSPPEHFPALSDCLAAARIRWPGKSLVFCDCEVSPGAVARFTSKGASVARLRRSGLPGRLVVEGVAPALTSATRLARELRCKPLAIAPGSEALFDASITLGTAAFTPLLDAVTRLLRQCGVRDTEAVQLAAGLFTKTASEYAHSGRQSWQWHVEEPRAEHLLAQFASVEEPLRGLLAHLVLAGFGAFERHPDVAAALRASFSPPTAR